MTTEGSILLSVALFGCTFPALTPAAASGPFITVDPPPILPAPLLNADGTVRQYYTGLEDLLEAACQRAPRNMTTAEWRQFMGNKPYRRTCPNLPPGN